MVDIGDIDPEELERRAKRREEGEAVEVVFETSDLRVIVGARISEDGTSMLFIEVSSNLRELTREAYEEIARKQDHLEWKLTDLGYSSFHDDMVLIAEKVTTAKNLATDLQRVSAIIANVLLMDAADLVGK